MLGMIINTVVTIVLVVGVVLVVAVLHGQDLDQ